MRENRLQSTIRNLGIAGENMNAARSRIRDVDFAAETANYTQNRILQQSGVSLMSQANSWLSLLYYLITLNKLDNIDS